MLVYVTETADTLVASKSSKMSITHMHFHSGKEKTMKSFRIVLDFNTTSHNIVQVAVIFTGLHIMYTL